MTSYKLIYFASPLKGRAEPIKFLFSYAGVDFVDEGIQDQDWQKIKPTMPYGQVPILEVNGKRIHQSIAICRYLAKQFGLAGKNDWEALEIDATVDTITDFRIKVSDFYYEKHPEIKAQKFQTVKDLLPYYMEKFDDQVKRNNGYFVNGKISWADILFVSYIDLMNYRTGLNVIEKAENLKALERKILAESGIKAWVEKHPKEYK